MSLAKTAIFGIGETEQGRISNESREIAVRAAIAAMADAGIDKCLSRQHNGRKAAHRHS